MAVGVAVGTSMLADAPGTRGVPFWSSGECERVVQLRDIVLLRKMSIVIIFVFCGGSWATVGVLVLERRRKKGTKIKIFNHMCSVIFGYRILYIPVNN